MRSKTLFSVLVLVVVALTSSVGLAQAAPPGHDKVTICHKPGTPDEQTKQVTRTSLPAHLGHGDTEGPCGPPPPVDADGDGYAADVDCNDADPAIHPGAVEIPDDGVDNDCDGTIDRAADDDDGDGYDRISAGGTDCNDHDSTINPSATDIPNDGIDQNCDGADLVVGDGSVRVTLTWDSDDDVDLHVVDASGERTYYGHRNSASGGSLDRDDNASSACGADPEPGGVENVFWPAVPAAPSGTYTVEVYSYRDCSPAQTNYTLQVFVGGFLVETRSGTAGGPRDSGQPYGPLMDSTTFIVP